jgi:hypothetical protein
MIDERFILHRYKATSHAAVVAAVLLSFFFLREYYGRGGLRLDLLATLVAMAVTKVAAMVYYRRVQ